jgi:sigma-B regulation protein RsbU (phosphoserine phosphatase)
VIADVADKGVPAALFMAMSRTLLRAAAINRISPAETLMRVNELLHNDSRSDLFVTVFYAVWTPDTGEVIFASGGHNPPLLITHPNGLRRSPVVRELRTKGMALGILPSIQVEEQTIHLVPGDVLAVYTDGITEAMQADYTIWGTERLVTTLCKLHNRPANDIMAGILSAVDRFVGDAPQSDDLTFWLLQRQPAPRKKKKAK